MTDLASRSTKELSKTGARMPVCDFNSKVPLTHKAEGDESEREMYLTLLGPESEHMRRQLARIQQKEMGKEDGPVRDLSNEDLDKELRDNCNLLAKLTVGGLVFYKDKWVDVTSDNAADLYYDLLLLRMQALNFIQSPGKFAKG